MNSPSTARACKGRLTFKLQLGEWAEEKSPGRPPLCISMASDLLGRLPKDTALTKDGRIPRTGGKREMMIGHSLNPLSQNARQQLAATSFASPLLCF